MNRRDLLAGVGASALALPYVSAALASLSSADDMPLLTAGESSTQLAPNGYPKTDIWSYGGRLPGPEIRVAQGARVQRLFQNNLPQPSSVHWHGIRLVNGMDGVSGLTQDPVPSGETFAYDFVAPDAGTYWYHPHNRTWEQLARGLYGPLIIEEAEAPEIDREFTWMLDDWRLSDDAQIHTDSLGSMHDWSHAGRLGNWITVNGDGDSSLTAKQHERLRLRLINASNARIFDLDLVGLSGWVMALDGQPLEKPFEAGRLSLAPAQRIDLFVDVVAAPGEEAFLAYYDDGDERFALVQIAVAGSQRRAQLSAPKALPPNDLPKIVGLDGVRQETLTMEGGAMGRFSGATLNGTFRDMRELIGLGKAWAFNGQADQGAEPWLQMNRGEPIRIRIVNQTAWPHAMHLHGHHFQQVLPNGQLGPYRDTILMSRRDQIEIAFTAVNPGDWLLHCHMVDHAAAGMTTWLRVV